MPDDKELHSLVAPQHLNGKNGNGTNGHGPNGNGHNGNGPNGYYSNGYGNLPEQYSMYPAYSFPETEPEDAGVSLSHYLWILKRHKWKIIAFVAAAVACTIIVSSRLTPIYEAVATIDIDRQAPSSILGTEASREAPNDADQFLATQLKLIQSDSVLRPVVDRLHLTSAEISGGGDKTKALNPNEGPISLSHLKVTRPSNTYLLLISYRSSDRRLAAEVANAVALSYIEHTYDIRFRASAGLSTYMEKQLEALKAKMEQSSAALAGFEKAMDVIDPDQKTSILTSRLLQLNTAYTEAQADRVRKEAGFNAVRNGELEALEASTQGEQLRALSAHMDEAREKFSLVESQYAPNHPEYKKAASQLVELQRQFDALKNNIGKRVASEYEEAANREAMLRGDVTATKAEFDRINARSYQYKALKQEADSDKTLYDELIRKIKEAGINSSFQNSAIRMADNARPGTKPVFPDMRMNALLALLFSTLLACGAAIMADTLDNTVRDPEQIQKGLKTEVLGALPVVKGWRGRLPSLLPPHEGKNGELVKVRPRNSQASAYEEAVRTLRDSILLSDVGRRPKSLLFTSATPREGKTTTSTHLAIAHSLQKRRTLLIDADLRRPGVHTRLGLLNEFGIRNVITNGMAWRDTIRKPEGYPDLEVITAGPASTRAADRVGSILEKILMEAESEYDLVVVDGPPLLGFAEPLQMAAVVDGVVIVTLAGQTNRNAVASVVSSLKRLKANVIGVALNEVREDMSDRYYYYGYYGSYYSRYYKPAKG